MANGDGNGTMAIMRTLGKWALGILATLITAGILAGAAASVATRIDVGIMAHDMSLVKNSIGVNSNRIEQLSRDITVLESKIDQHMRDTGGGQ